MNQSERMERLEMARHWIECYRKRGKAFTLGEFCEESALPYDWLSDQPVFQDLQRLHVELDDSPIMVRIRTAFQANPNATNEQVATYAKCGPNTVNRYRKAMGMPVPKASKYVRSPKQEKKKQTPVDQVRVNRCINTVIAKMREYKWRPSLLNIAITCGASKSEIRDPENLSAFMQAVVEGLLKNPHVVVGEDRYTGKTIYCYSDARQEAA